MKVKELIEKLQVVDQDSKILIYISAMGWGYGCEPTEVKADENNNFVTIRGNED